MSEKYDLSEIYVICLQDNTASVRVMEKCGFESLYVGEGEYPGEISLIVKNIWKR